MKWGPISLNLITVMWMWIGESWFPREIGAADRVNLNLWILKKTALLKVAEYY